MTMPLSYAFQPQPPPHPKTTGGKRGPSAPISINSSSSSNEDEDSDTGITDFSPPIPSRLISLDNTATPNTKTSVLSLSNLPSPRAHITNKKSSLSYSPRSVHNNNNLNTSSNSNTNVYSLNSLSSNHNSNPVGSVHSNDVLCPTITNTNSLHGLSSANNNSNLNNLNNSLHSTALLPKSHPPSITIPLSSKDSTTIPSISNSSLSPTIPTQNTSSNSNSTNNTNSSSHDSSKENSCPSSSPRNRSCSPSSTFAYEHDHDYENVASPCSSTASGPIYVRQPGFQHHAHEVVANKVKKKKTNPFDVREGLKKREATPPKLKPKRGTIPMKLRALPQSFWQQPNVAQQVSPATMFPILPPLCNKDTEEAMDERPVTPPEDKEGSKRTSERKITVANTDLLFKLFEGIGEEKKSGSSKSKQSNKTKKQIPKSNTKGLFMGKDPFLMEDVTEKIFPQLTLEGSKFSSGGGNTSLQLVTLREGDRTVTFPSLSTNDQNYPQLLNELVMHI